MRDISRRSFLGGTALTASTLLAACGQQAGDSANNEDKKVVRFGIGLLVLRLTCRRTA